MKPVKINYFSAKSHFGLIILLILIVPGCNHRMVVNYLIESNPTGGIVEVDGVEVGNTPTTVRIVAPMPQKKNSDSVSDQITGEIMTNITVSPLPEMKGLLCSKTKVFRIADYSSGSTFFFDLRQDNPFPVSPANFKLDSIHKVPRIQKVEKKTLVDP